MPASPPRAQHDVGGTTNRMVPKPSGARRAVRVPVAGAETGAETEAETKAETEVATAVKV